MTLDEMKTRVEKIAADKRTHGWKDLCEYGGEKWQKHDICFARVFDDIHGADYGWFYSLAYGSRPAPIPICPDRTMGEEVTPYHEWLLSNDSPFWGVTKHLAIKDPAWIVKNAYVWEDTRELDYKLMYCFLIATRQIWEMPTETQNFYDFLEKGYPPNLAALMSQGLFKDGDNYFLAGPRGHRVLSANIFKYRIHWLTASPKVSKPIKGYTGYLSTAEDIFGGTKVPGKYRCEHLWARDTKPHNLEDIAADLMKGVEE